VIEYPPGFTCELTLLRLERYVVSALPRAEALAVAEHLEACPSCAHRVVLVRLTAGEAGARDG
jgi:anti-sigma factor RsiW